MKKNMVNNGGTHNKVFEWIALFIVIHYCLFRFFETTTFFFAFSDTYRTITFTCVVIVGVLRLLLGLWEDYRTAINIRAKQMVLLKGLLVVTASIPCILLANRFGYSFFAYLPFIAFCLYGLSVNQVLKAFSISIGIILVITILCALSGSIQNYLYLGKGEKGRIRGSYGIGYPTDFASYFIYLFLFIWVVQKKHTWLHATLFNIFALLMGWMIYVYPHSETSTLLSIVCAVVVLYDIIDQKILINHKGTRWISKIGQGLATGAFPILGICFCVLTWLYGQGNIFAIRLDQWMSSRLVLSWHAFQKYGVNALGALTPQNGSGHGLIHTANYEFIDSTYGLILIRYGWILTLIITVLWVWMTHKAYKTNHRRLALAMAVIAIHSFSEHHFTELNFNILLAMPLCAFPIIHDEEKKFVLSSKKKAGWISGIIISTVFVLLLPSILSWTRCVFSLEGWTGGGNKSLIAMFVWLLCLGVCAALWFMLYWAIKDWMETKKASFLSVLGIATAICAVLVGITGINERITDGINEFKPQLEADTEAVNFVLDAAEEPVYAGQKEELYHRSFKGISGRILSPEEIARNGKGTVLLEHDNEGYQLINTGARYTELSPYTGLFTYDESVINALSAKGYQFHGYFSAEQKDDLAAYSDMNGLLFADNGELCLWGKDHSLLHGPYVDQFAGDYQATYVLHLVDEEVLKQGGDRVVCHILVSALWGQDHRAERFIKASEFDQDGYLTVSLNYSVEDTQGVEYLVYCWDDIAVWINQITWKQIPTKDVWRSFTKEGYLESERFFTPEGVPQDQGSGYYGIAYHYDNENRNIIKIQYLDMDGRNKKTTLNGCAEIQREYNTNGQIIREEYFDDNGVPCNRCGGYSIVFQEYDDNHRLYSRKYKDASDNLILRTDGFAEARWEKGKDNSCVNLMLYDLEGNEVVIEHHNLATNLRYDSSVWSDWMIPKSDSINSCFTIGSVILGEKAKGDTYTCQIEIEFSDVRQMEGEDFGFWSQGSTDGNWSTGNIWDSKLICLSVPPKDGIYKFTTTRTLDEDMARVSTFNIGFRCDNWASGKFRVRHIKIEKGDEATEWSPGI